MSRIIATRITLLFASFLTGLFLFTGQYTFFVAARAEDRIVGRNTEIAAPEKNNRLNNYQQYTNNTQYTNQQYTKETVPSIYASYTDAPNNAGTTPVSVVQNNFNSSSPAGELNLNNKTIPTNNAVLTNKTDPEKNTALTNKTIPTNNALLANNTDPEKDSLPNKPIKFVLTRQGIIRSGYVFDRSNSIYLQMENGKGGFTISKLDILHIASSRDELFVARLALIPPTDVAEQLKLADWAVRNQLIPPALRMLNELLPVADFSSRDIIAKKIRELELVEKIRLDAIAKKDQNFETVRNTDPEKEDRINWEKWAKTFPVSVQEQFIKSIQPVLNKRCGSEGCHAQPDNRKFTILRDKTGRKNRLYSLKNLGAVLSGVNFFEPDKSPILSHPNIQNENGERIYPFGNDSSTLRDYKSFLKWINSTSGKIKEIAPLPVSPTEKQDEPVNAIKVVNPTEPDKSIMTILQQEKQNEANVAPKNSGSIPTQTQTTESVGSPATAKISAVPAFADLPADAKDNFVIQTAGSKKKEPETTALGTATVSKPTTNQVIPRDVYDPVQFNSRYHPNK